MKKKKNKNNPVKKNIKIQPTVPSEKQDEKFDFGGLPDRDLKKNLGCG